MTLKRPARVIRLSALPEFLGVQRTVIDRMVKEGKLHPFSPTGRRARVVSEDEIAGLQADALAKANAAAESDADA